MSETQYTPGVCNINPAEVAYRRKAFYLGLAIGIPLFLVLLAVGAHPAYGLIMFIPAWIGAIGYLQARHKFCVGYAASGVHSASDTYADVASVTDESDRFKDQKKARNLNLQSLFIGVLIALITSAVLLLRSPF